MPKNDSHIEMASAVLSAFGLSAPLQAEFVSGGLLHRLLRVETSDGTYALKLFSPRSTEEPSARARLEWAETVAELARQGGVPAMVALCGPDGHFLQSVDGQWITLYPWADGIILPPTAAGLEQCHIMGRNLAKLHSLAIRFPDQAAPIPEAFPPGHFIGRSTAATSQKMSWAPRLAEAAQELESINAIAMASQLELRSGWVTGHLDCDQKNVLWEANDPTILDWESAKSIHPALEAMGAALSWAGQSAGNPQSDSFLAFFEGYLSVHSLSPDELNRAVNAVLGKWIIWLDFNIERLLDLKIQGSAEEVTAFDAGMHALSTTLMLRADAPKYRKWISRLRFPKSL